jgi:hypothetical protein
VLDIATLRTNTALLTVVQSFKRAPVLPQAATEDAAVPGAPPCEECKTRRASRHCESCAVSFCGACAGAVHRPRVMQSHKMRPWSASVSATFCSQHKEKLVLFCLACGLPLCLLCKQDAHHSAHTTPLLRDHVRTLLGPVAQTLTAADDLAKGIDQRLESAAHMQQRQTNALRQTEDSLRTAFGGLAAALRRCEEQMLVDVRQRSGQRLAPVAAELAQFSTIRSLLRAFCEDGKQAQADGDLSTLSFAQKMDGRWRELHTLAETALSVSSEKKDNGDEEDELGRLSHAQLQLLYALEQRVLAAQQSRQQTEGRVPCHSSLL